MKCRKDSLSLSQNFWLRIWFVLLWLIRWILTTNYQAPHIGMSQILLHFVVVHVTICGWGGRLPCNPHVCTYVYTWFSSVSILPFCCMGSLGRGWAGFGAASSHSVFLQCFLWFLVMHIIYMVTWLKSISGCPSCPGGGLPGYNSTPWGSGLDTL